LPREVFVAGQVLTAAELNVVSDQSVMVFAGTAARGSAIPSPSEGMVTYLADSDEVEVYTTSWGAIGGGKILQVVSTTKTDTFSSTSTSFTDVTGLSVSITPESTSSKIYVVVNMGVSGGGNSADTYQLVRDSTAIGSGTSGTTYNGFYATNVYSFSGNGNHIVPIGTNFLDSPNTTSSTTYKVQVKVAGYTAYVNRIGANTAYGVSSTITAMEVAG